MTETVGTQNKDTNTDTKKELKETMGYCEHEKQEQKPKNPELNIMHFIIYTKLLLLLF